MTRKARGTKWRPRRGVAHQNRAMAAGLEDAEELAGGLFHGVAEFGDACDVGQVGGEFAVGIADDVEIGGGVRIKSTLSRPMKDRSRTSAQTSRLPSDLDLGRLGASEGSKAVAFSQIAMASGLMSQPMKRRLRSLHSLRVVPPPAMGSRTVWPGSEYIWMMLRATCGAKLPRYLLLWVAHAPRSGNDQTVVNWGFGDDTFDTLFAGLTVRLFILNSQNSFSYGGPRPRCCFRIVAKISTGSTAYRLQKENISLLSLLNDRFTIKIRIRVYPGIHQFLYELICAMFSGILQLGRMNLNAKQ